MIATPVQVLVRATRQVATPKPAFTPRIRAGSSPACWTGLLPVSTSAQRAGTCTRRSSVRRS